MRLSRKTKPLILIILGIIFAFSPISATNLSCISEKKHTILDFKNKNPLIKDNLKFSAIIGKIHIDNNWTDAKSAGICTGNGTYSEPYIIEDLVIDGGSSGSCIRIENSNAFFRIENCTLYNSRKNFPSAGIRLSYVSNAHLIDNNCSLNEIGIWLSNSNNNTISSNIITNNYGGIHNFGGIYLFESDHNTISENTENTEQSNFHYSIRLLDSNNNMILTNILNSGMYLDGINNNISGNKMDKSGLGIYPGNTENFYSQNIDTTNLVNGKPLYYYTNEEYLKQNNFSNAGQIILVSCKNSLLTDLNLSYSDTGISLINSNNITIWGNMVNNNRRDGLYLFGGGNHNISNNVISYNNEYGILLVYCSDNTFLENNISYNNYHGFDCYRLENSFIFGNNINHNKNYGINFINCINNAITGNSLIGNEKCFNEAFSEGNVFENNVCRDRPSAIPGYNLFFLLSILSIIAIIISKRVKKS